MKKLIRNETKINAASRLLTEPRGELQTRKFSSLIFSKFFLISFLISVSSLACWLLLFVASPVPERRALSMVSLDRVLDFPWNKKSCYLYWADARFSTLGPRRTRDNVFCFVTECLSSNSEGVALRGVANDGCLGDYSRSLGFTPFLKKRAETCRCNQSGV